jgi:hypothetical protein
MFESASTTVGALCAVGGVALAFFWPLGRKDGEHLLFNLVIIALFIFAAFNLIPKNVVESDAAVLVVGLAVGGLAVLVRSIRRWLKYFQGVVSRRTSPYYWYRRAFTRRRQR